MCPWLDTTTPSLKSTLISCLPLHSFFFPPQPHNWARSANWSWIRLAVLHGSDQSCGFCYSSAEKWIPLLQLWFGQWGHQHHDPQQNQWWPVAQGNGPRQVGSTLRWQPLAFLWCQYLGPVETLTLECAAGLKNKASVLYSCLNRRKCEETSEFVFDLFALCLWFQNICQDNRVFSSSNYASSLKE